MTQGIYGPIYTASLTLPGPLASWENKLRARLALIGSTEFPLIWTGATMRTGLSYSHLSRLTLPTSETGYTGEPATWATPLTAPNFTGAGAQGSVELAFQMAGATWATPTKMSAGGTAEDFLRRKSRHMKNPTEALTDLKMQMVETVKGVWPTALARDGEHGGWTDAEWITCYDGKARRTKPGLPLLAHGIPHRMAKWGGFGNAIVPQLAAEVLTAYLEAYPDA